MESYRHTDLNSFASKTGPVTWSRKSSYDNFRLMNLYKAAKQTTQRFWRKTSYYLKERSTEFSRWRRRA
eukprot:jgi/Botrbrau1/373/Bobra.110_2s0029.1